MNILVAGGAGYIGSHTCKALAAAGHTPVAFDNLSQGHEWAVKWGPLVRGDLLSADDLDRVFSTYDIQGVIHFAAHCYVGESVSDPADYYRNNVIGSWTLLEAMRRAGCDCLVFSSTCATYGVPDQLPISEECQQNPINPYGATKLVIERMLADYAVPYGLRSIAFRYFNAAGADSEAEIGEAHDPEPHLIPRLLNVALGKAPQAVVFGTDYPTPDGSCIRDYIHVADLAAAHVAGIERLLAGESGGVYNLGTGEGVSVLDMISLVEKVTNRPIPYELRERRPGDPPVLVADPGAALRDLSWRATMSAPEHIVSSAWRWHRQHFAAIAKQRESRSAS